MWDDLWKNLHEKFHERMEEMQKSRGLRIWILHILDENGPRNGVEIMDDVQKHHEAFHRLHHRGHRHGHHRGHGHSKRPSPGSIYPMLKKMVEEDLIVKMEDGRYDLTDKGREIVYKIFGHWHGRHGKNMDRSAFAIESALTEIDGYISYLEDIKKEKLTPHEEHIEVLSERLKKIKESLKEDN